ncbi:related to hook3 protein [Cephalotrichum gorgonifer]|uniref:Related to hook3 protein n=1 Tax=Cephalotrichum gorgonifer TaxID=2041049 RepID=A0AAE8N2N5_9PEZI|nr:related to hook3 protein [Cephalotrichum gorgonifer]
MPYTPSAREALLKWVNNGFPNVDVASTWADLADGIQLSQVLQDLDPQYDASDIDRDPPPSTPKWLVKKKNLQALHRSLFRYIHRECPDLDPLVRSADWRTLADDPSEESLVKLVSITVAVAFLGPEPAKYVSRLRESGQFDQNTQLEIQQIIMDKDKEVKEAAERADVEDALDQAMDARDVGLAFEEERATLLSQIEIAKKQHADTITRLEHLQDSYDSLRLEESKLQRELEVLRKVKQDGASDSQIIKSLEDKIAELDELISTQESQVEDDRIAKEKLRHQVATLTKQADRAQQLDDELSELRHRANELSRKANAAERLKQKLEQQQGLATEVQNLRFEKDQLLKKSQEHDRLVQKITALERTLAEVRSSHEQAEETVFLLNRQKQILEATILGEREEVTRLKDLRSHDEKFIKELQEQIGLSHTSGQSLEDELEGVPIKPAGLELEMSRLRAENALLRRSAETGETPQLRLELEDEQRKYTELQSKYTEIVERHSVAQDQISALVNDATGEGSVSFRDEALSLLPAVALNDEFYRSRAFNELRKQILQANLDLKNEQQRAADLDSQLADRDRDLLMVRSELSAAAKGGSEALEELKSTDQLISASLREELDLWRTRYKSLASELELSKSQVIEAFVAKDKFRKELDEITGVKGSTEDSNISEETIGQDVNKLSEKIEKLRERLKQRQEVSRPRTPVNGLGFSNIESSPDSSSWPSPIPLTSDPYGTGVPCSPLSDGSVSPKTVRSSGSVVRVDSPLARVLRTLSPPAISDKPTRQLEKSEQEKYELQRKLKAALATGGPSAAQKAATEQTIKNLQRENALIASAWYDLTSRLQSNHVVLQRRVEAPKSWLNKQRHLVNATPRR